MINSQSALKKLSDFLLLNAGFSTDNSLQSGKLAVALFFSYAQKHRLYTTPTDLGQTYLDEIRRIGTLEGPTYAKGLVGAGVVLENLAEQELLAKEMVDIRSYLGSLLLPLINEEKTTAIDLARGYTGAGLYLCYRLSNVIAQHHGATDQFTEQLKQYLQRAKPVIPSGYLSNNLHPQDMSIWTGAAGLSLFLRSIRNYGLYDRDFENIESEITNRLLHRLYNDDFDWYHTEAYLGLLYGSLVPGEPGLKDKLLSSFINFVNNAHAHLRELDHHNAAFTALLLTVIGEKYNYLPACALGEKICDQLNAMFANHAIGNLFNYNLAGNSVEMGLYRGICGTALSLLSLQTADYKWLKVLGIEV